MTTVQSTYPPFGQGSFDVSDIGAVATASYPTDGLGGHELVTAETLGAHWATLGYEAGTFEVIVEAILTAGAVFLFAEEGSHAYAATGLSTPISVSMKGGFNFTSNAGFTIHYRIQRYQS